LRPIVLAIGTGMHLGIGAFLGMWTFGLSMIIAYFSFIPPEWFARWIQSKRSPETPEIKNTPDDWQSRLQAYIETYVESVTPRSETAPDRVKEPMVVAPLRPQPVTVSSLSSPTVAVSQREAGTAAKVFTSDADHAETAAVPRVLLIERRVKRGFQLQEALLKEGYQCRVAIDPHQAAQSLAVENCDTLVVNATSMNRSQWNEFVSSMGDHPGPDLNLILVLQPWQWDWRADLPTSRVQAIRYPSQSHDVVDAVERVT
jgi:hypothetical protein